jgi:addiction module RelE/StbE family toxin
MRKVVWSNTFIKSIKRVIQRNPELPRNIEDTLRLLAQDPFTPKLRTHKLKGKLSGCWACNVKYNMRIVFQFVKSEDKEDNIFLIEIGTHDEIY